HDDVQMSIEDDGLVPSLSSSEDETSVGAQFIAPERLVDDVPIPYFQTPSPTDTFFNALRHRTEHLHGSLEITSNPEQGTKVLVRIPYPGTQEIVPPSTIPPTTEHVRVLIVDNQAVTRAGLRRLLESYPDIQVVGEAVDGVQAVSETMELGPQLVLMDTQLPNGQSMEALRQIKQLNLEARVLLLSSNDREDYLYETLRAGADGYILKDIVPDELAQAVRAVAHGEMLIQPQLANKLLFRAGKQGRNLAPYEALTAREQEVLQLLARGLRNKEIAARLYVSERTVTFHLQNIYQKLHVSGRTEALSKALEQGLLRT
ncbi:MAG: response regulator, partial [Chloroflexota bacterium]|nr:response regulator [Chloroflexota bacterium]